MRLTYHNDPGLKKLMVEEMKDHIAHDRLIQGMYDGTSPSGKFEGCAIGCAAETLSRRLGLDVEPDNHADVAEALGWPQWLAVLVDNVFEGLHVEAARQWAVDVLEAVPVGAEMTKEFRAKVYRNILIKIRENEAVESVEPPFASIDFAIDWLERSDLWDAAWEQLEPEEDRVSSTVRLLLMYVWDSDGEHDGSNVILNTRNRLPIRLLYNESHNDRRHRLTYAWVPGILEDLRSLQPKPGGASADVSQ